MQQRFNGKLRLFPILLAILLCLPGCTLRPGSTPVTEASQPHGNEAPGEGVVLPPLAGDAMLYPTYANSDSSYMGWGTPRMGLINARGETVAPIVYDQLSYVRNADETAITGLLAGRLDTKAQAYQWTYYDLNGKVLAEPTHRGWMSPFPGGRYAEIGRSYEFDDEAKDQSGGLWSLEKNRQLLAPQRWQSITPIGEHRFFVVVRDFNIIAINNVKEAYVFDAQSEKRIAAPAGVASAGYYNIGLNEPLIPAMNTTEKWGYVNRDLKWVVPPEFDEAEALRGRGWGIVIRYDTERSSVINAQGKSIYDFVGRLTAYGNYLVAENVTEGTNGLIRVNDGVCEELVKPAVDQMVFNMRGDLFAVCDKTAGTTVFRDFAAEKDIARLNTCYDRINSLTDALVELRIESGDMNGGTLVIYNLVDKREIPLPGGQYDAVESLCPWAVAASDYDETLERLVIDSKGKALDENGAGKYSFTGLTTLSYGGVSNGIAVYPWVTQGLYAGYIDQNGNWLYRQARYQWLDD